MAKKDEILILLHELKEEMRVVRSRLASIESNMERKVNRTDQLRDLEHKIRNHPPIIDYCE